MGTFPGEQSLIEEQSLLFRGCQAGNFTPHMRGRAGGGALQSAGMLPPSSMTQQGSRHGPRTRVWLGCAGKTHRQEELWPDLAAGRSLQPPA